MPLKASRAILIVAVLVLGLISAIKPIVLSPFDGIPGDYGDARFTITLLEHAYSYVFLNYPESFWSPSWQFFPFPNTLAMAEVMAGNMPLYAVFRLLSFDIQRSYQLWIVACCVLNYFSMFFLARMLRGNVITSTLAGFLFAFGMARVAQLNHSQLLPHYFSVLCMTALVHYFQSYQNSRSKSWALYAASFLFALQFWASIYLGFFLALTLPIIAVVILFNGEWRKIIFQSLWKHRIHVVGCTALVLCVMGPLIYHYGLMKTVTGYRSWGEARAGMITWDMLILPYHHAATYKWLHSAILERRTIGALEPWLFSGFLALASPLLYLWAARRNLNKLTLVLLISYALLLLLSIHIPHIDHGPYYFAYTHIPGFGAIRQISRMQLVFLGFQGLFLQLTLLRVFEKRQRLQSAFCLLALAAVIVENWVGAHDAFSKNSNEARLSHIQKQIEAQVQTQHCEAFFLALPDIDWKTNNDAIWLSLAMKVPTLNGYSGNVPPHWLLYPTEAVQPLHIDQFLSSLKTNLTTEHVCLVKARLE